MGISPELLPRVFERGVHSEDGGTGFGLAICKDIITAYEGKISIESEPGKGTEVTFTLPVFTEGSGKV
jgi:signal transduction histidine kinase